MTIFEIYWNMGAVVLLLSLSLVYNMLTEHQGLQGLQGGDVQKEEMFLFVIYVKKVPCLVKFVIRYNNDKKLSHKTKYGIQVKQFTLF